MIYSVYSRRHLTLMGGAALLAGCQRRDEESLGFYYRVKRGDTLSSISEDFALSQWELRRDNKLYSKELRAGDFIYIPRINTALAKKISKIAPKRRPHNWNYRRLEEQKTQQITKTPTAAPYGLAIVSRQAWGALPIRPNHSPMPTIKRVTLHHTSEYAGMAKLTDKETVFSIAKYHRDQRGWADIGYHYLIGRDGLIYEGRSEKLQGAHVSRNNENNLGISVIGDFVNKLPNPLQLNSLQNLLKYKLNENHLGIQDLYGHRDLKPTQCPGEMLYGWLQEYKKSTYHTLS